MLRFGPFFALALPLLAFASEDAAEFDPHKITPPPMPSGFVFSLLPQSFSSNPHLDMTIICQMTPEGKKRPLVTKEHPSYFLSHAAGYTETGDDGAHRQPIPEAVVRVLENALATNGYLPAPAGKRPEVTLIYHWGANALNRTGETLGSIIERAMLVGGPKFAKELYGVLLEQAKGWEVSNAEVDSDDAGPTVKRSSRDDTIEAVQKATRPTAGGMGDLVAESTGSVGSAAESAGRLLRSMTPLERFRKRDRRTEFLVEQTLQGVYFVVISAYDYDAMINHQKVLLWRARMTVDSTGVSLRDSVPSLIAQSGPFLGRDMDLPAALTPRQLSGKDKVDIGEMTVLPNPDDKKSSDKKKD